MANKIHRILQSMWHKGRKEYTIWTGDEIDRRAGVDEDDRMIASSMGLIKATGIERHRAYHITDLGKSLHSTMF